MTIYNKIRNLISDNQSTDDIDTDNQDTGNQESKVSSKQAPQETKKTPFYKNPFNWVIGIGTLLIARKLFAGEKRFTIRGVMYLTKNFRVGEFLRSAAIPELKDYKLTSNELSNLRRLATVMQKIRDDIGAPIVITSGGRPPHMTASEGKFKGMTFVDILKAKNYKPAEFSQHMDFSACDWTTKDKRWLVDVMKAMTNPYFFDAIGKTITQVIIYIENGVPDFIHLGVKSDINDFIKATAGARLLIGEVNTFTKDGTSTRTTKFHPYTELKLNELLKK